MTDLAIHTLLLLAVWGMLVGVDLVSFPQIMIARPLVAGAVAGLILGDVPAGLRVGAVLELFALDVLPVGATRYPDYGPASVAAAVVHAGSPWQVSLGVAVGVGLVTAVLGGWSMQIVRRANARAIQERVTALSAGDADAVRTLQYLGLLRDGIRALGLTAAGLLIGGFVVWLWQPRMADAAGLSLVAIAGGLAAAASGALRGAGRGRRLLWFGAGLAAACLWLVLG